MSSVKSMPIELAGGCLCGSVRYEIQFQKGDQWPPNPGSCQCTMCRKWTGAIIPSDIRVPLKRIKYPSTPTSDLKIYKASETGTRKFCGKCGSSISFEYVGKDHIAIHSGTIDEKYLIGEKIEGSLVQSMRGLEYDRTPSLGRDLFESDNGSHWYLENAIPGVTDNVLGVKYWVDSDTSTPYTDSNLI